MTKNDPVESSRFKMVMILATLMGVITNIYICVVINFLASGILLFSPILGALLFLIAYLLLRHNHMSSKTAFFGLSLVVMTEVVIHSYCLGWDSGFFYFTFLIPMVFMLNSKWKGIVMIIVNAVILAFVLVLWLLLDGQPSYYDIAGEHLSALRTINLIGTGFIVMVIMIYFIQVIHKKDRELVLANMALEAQNKEITAQHEHKQLLLKEIHHRVKNNLQIISSLISLQQRTVEDEQARSVLDQSRRRVEAIALIHQKLYQDENITRVNFKSYLKDIIRSQQEMNPEVVCHLDSDEVVLSLDVAVPLGLVVSEMVLNAYKHAFRDILSPELKVILRAVGDTDYELAISDNGIGLPEDFTLENDGSLGTEIIEALTTQINAVLTFFNDNGAQFKIRFQDA